MQTDTNVKSVGVITQQPLHLEPDGLDHCVQWRVDYNKVSFDVDARISTSDVDVGIFRGITRVGVHDDM